MRLALSVLASLLVIAQLDAETTRSHPAFSRIRPMQDDGWRLIANGMTRSPTFRHLIDRLEHSNVIVYIDLRPDMPSNRGGSLRFLARSTTTHFLKIHLNRRYTGSTLIALLGHELQHAVEVADAGGIDSVEDLRNLYRRLGERIGADQFDTAAARQAGYLVRQELSHRGRPDLRLARSESEPPLPEMEDLGDDIGVGEPRPGTVPAVGRVGTADADVELLQR